MDTDLFDEVVASIAKHYNADPETEEIAVDSILAFARFLKDREWWSSREILEELRDMVLVSAGDYRSDIDVIISGE